MTQFIFPVSNAVTQTGIVTAWLGQILRCKVNLTDLLLTCKRKQIRWYIEQQIIYCATLAALVLGTCNLLCKVRFIVFYLRVLQTNDPLSLGSYNPMVLGSYNPDSFRIKHFSDPNILQAATFLKTNIFWSYCFFTINQSNWLKRGQGFTPTKQQKWDLFTLQAQAVSVANPKIQEKENRTRMNCSKD